MPAFWIGNLIIPLPTKPPSSRKAKSHAGKAEAITKIALYETMLSMKKKGKMRRKISLLCTSSTGPHQYLSPFLLWRKNGDMRKKGAHIRSKKQNKKNRKELKKLNE